MLQIKQGDTFSFYADMKNEEGYPMTLPTSSFKCQIRDKMDRLYDTMSISTTSSLGKYLFTATNTNIWPLGTLVMDIQIEDGGIITSSDTVELQVIRGVTHE